MNNTNSALHTFFITIQGQDEEIAIAQVHSQPELAKRQWLGATEPFAKQAALLIKGSTALHYAANDGKDKLAVKLIEAGADVNAVNAHWYRSVLSWAANNARCSTTRLLLSHGASPTSYDAVHAAAYGDSSRGKAKSKNMPKR